VHPTLQLLHIVTPFETIVTRRAQRLVLRTDHQQQRSSYSSDPSFFTSFQKAFLKTFFSTAVTFLLCPRFQSHVVLHDLPAPCVGHAVQDDFSVIVEGALIK